MNAADQISAFKAAGYSEHCTGGNCVAWLRATSSGGHVLITGSDGGSLTIEETGDYFVIGTYDANGESLMDDCVDEAMDVDEAFRVADRLADNLGGGFPA